MPTLSDDARAASSGWARFGELEAETVLEYADLRRYPGTLAGGGWWAVVGEFDGPIHAWRFARVRTRTSPVSSLTTALDAGQAADGGTSRWRGPAPDQWHSSMDRALYQAAVRHTQDAVQAGRVYQANITRMLSAPLAERPDAAALAELLARGNPAPYAGAVDIPDSPHLPGAWVVSASPELSFAVENGLITSGPIKGTGATEEDLQVKDRAENVMITDLVRNDLQRICAPGTVTVTDLLRTEHHPGLVHLVSRVRGKLRDSPTRWPDLLAALHPPGSTSGAPKSTALELIRELETVPRGAYCGQFGWIDADANTARVAVAIRTFTWEQGQLRFGSGAGITLGSDPATEWAETELKAARLIGLASS